MLFILQTILQFVLILLVVESATNTAYAGESANDNHNPHWVSVARWYYVDIESFRNGEDSIDSAETPQQEAPSPADRKDRMKASESEPNGGDLQGVYQSLNYLDRLGFNAIYLTSPFVPGISRSRLSPQLRHISPKFAVADSRSEQKTKDQAYEENDFNKADDHLLRVISKAHAMDMRIVVEMPFDLDTNPRTNGNPLDSTSPTAIADQLYAQTKPWMDPNNDGDPSDGVDGWSVPCFSGQAGEVVQLWIGHCQEFNPNLAILRGHQIDQLKCRLDDLHIDTSIGQTILRFFQLKKTSPDIDTLSQALGRLSNSNTKQKAPPPIRFLGSEVTGRALTQILSDEVSNEHTAPQEPVSQTAIAKLKLAMILHAFLPGPTINYFGEEIGLLDGSGGSSQARMWQDSADKDLKLGIASDDILALVHLLNAMRAQRQILQTGKLEHVQLDASSDVLAWARVQGRSQFILVMNSGPERRKAVLDVALPGQRVGLLTPQISPRKSSRWKRPTKSRQLSRIIMGGSQQIANEWGEIEFWLAPHSVSYVIVGEQGLD